MTPDALRRVRAGHPWIYDRSVLDAGDHAAPGDLAVVFDDRRRFAAIGLWDPASPIRVRVLHAGRPVTVDAAFWESRLVEALERRRPLVDDATTTGWRWLHGEADGTGGLVLDRYDGTLVAKVYSAAWLPHLRTVLPLARDLVGADRVVVRLARTMAGDPALAAAGIADGSVVAGPPVLEPVPFLEHGLAFVADVVAGQKTGHFLDQRDNRALVGALVAEQAAAGRAPEVLDVFCCTGGFSVHAAAGGAGLIRSVDLASPALATTRANVARNRHLPAVAAAVHETEEGDAFEVLAAHAAAGRRWDVVIVDPPSFAPRADAVDRARRAYAKLTHLALDVVRPGGLLVQSSCSSRVRPADFYATVTGAAADAGATLAEVARTGHALDHPGSAPRVVFDEGTYLKTLVARVVDR